LGPKQTLPLAVAADIPLQESAPAHAAELSPTTIFWRTTPLPIYRLRTLKRIQKGRRHHFIHQWFFFTGFLTYVPPRPTNVTGFFRQLGLARLDTSFCLVRAIHPALGQGQN